MKKLAPLALLALLGLAAFQQYTITRYPQPDNVTCYGDPKPFDCVYIPPTGGKATETATIGPRPTSTPTSPATATNTPIAPSATLGPTLPPSSPTRTATPAPPLLVNASFEQDNHVGWTFVSLWPDTPSVNDERGDPRSRFDGAQSFRVWNNYYCVAGVVYQRIPVAPFTTLDFSAWVRSWMAPSGVFPDNHDPNAYDEMRVGIDPSGGTNPLSTGIIWNRAFGLKDGRVLTTRATAFASHVTVFIWFSAGVRDVTGTACEWAHLNNYLFIDGAALDVVR